MGGACGMFVGRKSDVYRVLVREHEGNRPPGRSKCRWEDNIKMVLKYIL